MTPGTRKNTMKRHVTTILLSLTLTLILANAGYSQTSNNSTNDRAAIVSLCEKAKDEVIASRVLIASYEKTLAAQEKEQNLSDAEIKALREALDHEKKALASSELAIAEYKKALAKEVKKKNFYKRMVKGLTIVAAGAVVFAVLK